MGGADAANLGEQVELEERGVQLDDLPITRGERLNVQGVSCRRIDVELNRHLKAGGLGRGTKGGGDAGPPSSHR